MIQVVIRSGMVWEVLCNDPSEKSINIEVVDMDIPKLEIITPTLNEKEMDKNREKVEKDIEERGQM